MYKKIFDVVVIVALVGLGYYVFTLSKTVYQDLSSSNQNLLENYDQQARLTQTYSGLYQTSQLQLASVTSDLEATKILYAQSENILKSTSLELDQTKAILKETELMLSQLREDTQSFVKMTGKAIELESTNADLKAQMAAIRDHLRFLSGDVKDMPEAGQLMKYFKGKIHLVKGKIKGFKRDAHELIIAAQKEHDRIKTVLGNNGYFMREGKNIQIDYAKFQTADPSSVNNNTSSASAEKSTANNVDISVKFVD